MVDHVFTLEPKLGDINVDYNNVDKLSGYPKSGFVEGRARLTTYSLGDLGITQTKTGTSSEKISKQTKDVVNVIEREIQLDTHPKGDSNGDCYFLYRNPSVVSCTGIGCCDGTGYGSNYKFKTCFNKTTRVLHIRSLRGAKVGQKFKTLTPIPNWP